MVCHLDILVGRQQIDAEHLTNRNDDDNHKSCQEDIYGILRVLWYLLVKSSGVRAIDIRVLLRIFELCLELWILVEVKASVPTVCHSCQYSYEACRNRHHYYLDIAHREAVVGRYCGESHDSGSYGRASDAYLCRDRRDGTWSFGADSFLQGNVADNRHQGVYDMSGTNQHRKQEGGQRCQEGDTVGVLSQHLLRNLNHPVHTA